MDLASGVATPRIFLVDPKDRGRFGAGFGTTRPLHGALSGHSFLYPFRALSLPFSNVQISMVQIVRVPFLARVREFAYRFDAEDVGLFLFPVYSRFSGPRPSVTALANGLPDDTFALSSGDSDPAIGYLSFESQAALNYQRVPCGMMLPFFPCTLGFYAVNHASDSAAHTLSGWFSVEEVLV